MAFGFNDGGTSNLIRGWASAPRMGSAGDRSAAAFQEAIGKVRLSDLQDLGLSTLGMPGAGPGGTAMPYDEVDPSAIAFEALKAQSRGDSERAAKLGSMAELATAGRDEVLRRRQKGFNQYGEKVRKGEVLSGGNAYDGQRNEMITAQTGAALASHARAGRPAVMPEADRAMSLSDHMRLNPGAVMREMTRSPMQFTERDYPDVPGGGAGMALGGDEGAAFAGLRGAAEAQGFAPAPGLAEMAGRFRPANSRPTTTRTRFSAFGGR